MEWIADSGSWLISQDYLLLGDVALHGRKKNANGKWTDEIFYGGTEIGSRSANMFEICNILSSCGGFSFSATFLPHSVWNVRCVHTQKPGEFKNKSLNINSNNNTHKKNELVWYRITLRAIAYLICLYIYFFFHSSISGCWPLMLLFLEDQFSLERFFPCCFFCSCLIRTLSNHVI